MYVGDGRWAWQPKFALYSICARYTAIPVNTLVSLAFTRAEISAFKQTNIQTDEQKDRQTDRQRYRQKESPSATTFHLSELVVYAQ